jgi:hypothetical protein
MPIGDPAGQQSTTAKEQNALEKAGKESNNSLFKAMTNRLTTLASTISKPPTTGGRRRTHRLKRRTHRLKRRTHRLKRRTHRVRRHK